MVRLSVEIRAELAMRMQIASDHSGSKECLNASQVSCRAFETQRLLECQKCGSLIRPVPSQRWRIVGRTSAGGNPVWLPAIWPFFAV